MTYQAWSPVQPVCLICGDNLALDDIAPDCTDCCGRCWRKYQPRVGICFACSWRGPVINAVPGQKCPGCGGDDLCFPDSEIDLQ